MIDDNWEEERRSKLLRAYQREFADDYDQRVEERRLREQREREENRRYAEGIQKANERDKELRDQIESERKRLVNAENQRLIRERMQIAEERRRADRVVEEVTKKKVAEEKNREVDIYEQRQAAMRDHLRKLARQVEEQRRLRARKEKERNAPDGTGLRFSAEKRKAYECEECHGLYDLKNMNEKLSKQDI